MLFELFLLQTEPDLLGNGREINGALTISILCFALLSGGVQKSEHITRPKSHFSKQQENKQPETSLQHLKTLLECVCIQLAIEHHHQETN